MRKIALALLATAGVLLLVAVAGRLTPGSGNASSHREAPLISEDPSADNTDLYAFRSPDRPDTFTIISNWIPAEDPAAGPIYYTFSPSARYLINIDRNSDGKADIVYRFEFKRNVGQFFLGDTVQPYTVTKIVNGKATVVGQGLKTPPNNIGPRSTPNYRQLAAAGVGTLSDGVKVFAGQREDAFYADIGAIFDLLAIRKGVGNQGGGKDFFAGYAVHAVALQIPITQVDNANHTIGIWSSTERKQITVTITKNKGKTKKQTTTSYVQVSRIGNPLFNELIVPTGRKDAWNRGTPVSDAGFVQLVREPILAKVINTVYKLGVKETGRDDLVQVLLTGVPSLNFTGPKPLDELRLNLSIPPTDPAKLNRLGVLAGDNAGYPNGRRLEDDVIDISEQAVAGALIGTKLPLGDGVDRNDVTRLPAFPYEADPPAGFDNTKGVQQP